MQLACLLFAVIIFYLFPFKEQMTVSLSGLNSFVSSILRGRRGENKGQGKFQTTQIKRSEFLLSNRVPGSNYLKLQS